MKIWNDNLCDSHLLNDNRTRHNSQSNPTVKIVHEVEGVYKSWLLDVAECNHSEPQKSRELKQKLLHRHHHHHHRHCKACNFQSVCAHGQVGGSEPQKRHSWTFMEHSWQSMIWWWEEHSFLHAIILVVSVLDRVFDRSADPIMSESVTLHFSTILMSAY